MLLTSSRVATQLRRWCNTAHWWSSASRCLSLVGCSPAQRPRRPPLDSISSRRRSAAFVERSTRRRLVGRARPRRLSTALSACQCRCVVDQPQRLGVESSSGSEQGRHRRACERRRPPPTPGGRWSVSVGRARPHAPPPPTSIENL